MWNVHESWFLFLNVYFDLIAVSEFSELFVEENHPNPQFLNIEWRPILKLRSQPQMLTNLRFQNSFRLFKIWSIMHTVASK